MNSYLKDLKKVKNHLQENPQGLTVSQIADFLNVNRNSVAKYMDVLLISGQVEMRQIGPAKLYVLSSSVPTSELLDYSNDGMIFFDESFKILQTNKKIDELFEFEEELEDKKLFDIKHEFFKSDEFLLDCRKVEEIGAATNCQKIENEDMRKFLKYKLFKITYENGKPGYGLVITDITSSKEKELSLKFRVKFEELIATIATEFIGVEDKDVPIEIFRALKKIGEVGEVDRTFIYFFSKDHKKGISPYHWSRNPDKAKDFEEELNLDNYRCWIDTLLKFETVFLYDSGKLAKHEKYFLKKFELSSVAIVPLIWDGNLVGCLGVAMEDKNRVWSDKTTNMLTMCSKVFVEVFKKFELLEEYYQ